MKKTFLNSIRTEMGKLSGISIFILLMAFGGTIGCQNGHRNADRRAFYGSSGIPFQPGGRLAAVLLQENATSANTVSTNAYPGEQGSGTQQNGDRYPGEAESTLKGTTAAGGFGVQIGDKGAVEVIALYENQTRVVGDSSQFGYRFMNSSYISSGVSGRGTGSMVRLDGIRTSGDLKSQIQYSSDGSLLYATLTERDEVLVVPMYDNGGIGQAYRIGVGDEPTEITTARTPWGELAAVATKGGLSIIAADRIDARTGTAVAGPLRERVRLGPTGQVTAVQFSPNGEWLLVGYNPIGTVANNRVGSRVELCHIGTMVAQPESPYQTYGETGFGRGCFPGNPSVIAQTQHGLAYSGTYGGSPYPSEGVGTQSVPGIPIKLAVNNNMAVFLSSVYGPYRLATPDIDDMNDYLDSILATGFIEQFGFVGAPTNFANRNYIDIALHPRSDNILVLEGSRLLTYSTDNVYALGRVDDQIQLNGAKPVAMAMDPDPESAEFLLIADASKNQLLVGRLDARSVRFNRVSDFIQLVGTPVDVAIRTRKQFRAPFAPHSGSQSADEIVEE